MKKLIYGKQCELVWLCIEERRWSSLQKSIRLKGRPKRIWEKQVEEHNMKIGVSREVVLLITEDF